MGELDDDAQLGPDDEENDQTIADEESARIREQFADVGRSLSKLTRAVANKSVDTGRGAVDVSRDKFDGAVRTVTFREYREEVDKALAEITQVLLVIDSRLRVLERHRRDDLVQRADDGT